MLVFSLFKFQNTMLCYAILTNRSHPRSRYLINKYIYVNKDDDSKDEQVIEVLNNGKLKFNN